MQKNLKLFIILGGLVSLIILFFLSSFSLLILLYLIITAIALYDIKQTKHSLWRNFPVLGRFRWVLEELRPPIRQYFVESDIDGVPFNRQTRGLIYRRSKDIVSTIPFGTKEDVYKTGYEWIAHSM